jgi:SWI/SNF-related matrix-associated actin-dependent regulator 1 of chromatin subfamily A
MLFSDRVQRARSILEPFILQRQKEQVLDGFPPKTSRVVYCEMDAAQKKIYYEYHNRFRSGKDSVRAAGTATNRTSNDQNNVWMQLRKAAIHSQLFRRHFTDKMVEEMADVLMRKVPQRRLKQENKKHLIAELKDLSDFELHVWCVDEPCVKSYDVPSEAWMKSGKVKQLIELLREFRRNGDRALVFTRFAKVNEILTECLMSADIPHLSFQGNTAVELRQDLIDQYNEDKDLTAFLLTTGAGGTGINLASANKVIIFDQSDNPQDDVQAENRAHRFGQTRPVEVIRLISKDTVEELVYRACQKKLELAKRVTGAGQPTADELDVEAEVRKMLAAQEKENDGDDEEGL